MLLMTSAHDQPAQAQTGDKRPIQVADLFRFKRVASPQVSPDGKYVVYSATEITDPVHNKSVSKLWLKDGNPLPRLLTNSAFKDANPRWSPDGRWILFESNRSGGSQLWIIPVAGGEARQLTTISTEASSGIWSPDGKHIAFVSAVYPEFSQLTFEESDQKNADKMAAIKDSPVKAKVFTKLFYRHWDSYVEDKRQHLFVCNVVANGNDLTISPPRDVTPGDRDSYPTSTTFSASQDFCFSPDSSHLIFTAVPAKNEAWSTNYDLCRVSIDNRSPEWSPLTADNAAADGLPMFAPDGKSLVYRRQRRAGFEADRWEIMWVACDPAGQFVGTPRSLSENIDLSFEEAVWLDDEKLIVSAERHANKPLFLLGKNGTLSEIGGSGTYANFSVARSARQFACVKSTGTMPPEVFMGEWSGGPAVPSINASNANTELLAELQFGDAQSVDIPCDDGTQMQMWIILPPNFDAKKKYPLGFLVHGGPQGVWGDGWSNRWNPQVWAAQGYIIALPNPRGSTSFGQTYVDQISGDWGGKCYTDLMSGLAYLEKLPNVDTTRMFAAGASFGGYMMNWFQGNTTKFKTLITHCGVYNFESMYATTEEIWFDEWEHGGPPWGESRHSYEKHSPHRLAENFQTPMLIIHNDLDFRVPVSEGHQLFTTLQRLGVPSKFVNFPDEGHWVLKPANSKYWHDQIFDWLKQYCPPGGR
jgi:dipeptidyl aminopeptidase/acylaminoacyl peptidase